MAQLLERQSELARLEAALAQARTGDGGVLVIEGEAGIGKTTLLHEAITRATNAGMQVWSARCAELERDHSWGVTRQLLAPAVARLSGDARRRLAEGPAALAQPVLGLTKANYAAVPGRPPDPGAVLHGLYWLVTELTARRPLLMAVDDVPWSDLASLDSLAFLARRIEGLSLLMVVTARSDELATAGGSLTELARPASGDTTRLRPLSEAAVAALVDELLPGAARPGFAARCHQVTGGVPFLVRELLKALADEAANPEAATAMALDQRGPLTVSRATDVRLRRLGEGVSQVAQAVVVLGHQASAERVAALTGSSPPAAAADLDRLITAGLLRAGTPVEFVHPLVRASIDQAIPHYLRSTLHERASDLATASGDDPEVAAGHLLATEVRVDAEHSRRLVAAATQAMRRAAPQSAIAYLRRAVPATPAGHARGQVLLELGRCEQAIRDPHASEHLLAARASLTDPSARARTALALADSLFYSFDLEGSRAVLDEALAELGTDEPALAAELQAMAAYAGYGLPALHAKVRGDLPRIRALAAEPGPATRALRIFVGMVEATEGEHTEDVLEIVQRGLDGGQLLADASADAVALALAVNALIFIDALDAAAALADSMLASARSAGLALGFVAASAHRGQVALRRGELSTAEAETRAALEVAHAHSLHFTIPFTLATLGDTLRERGAASEALDLIDTLPWPPGFAQTLAGATLRMTRGRLRLATGIQQAGITDLQEAGADLLALSIRNPNCQSWRSQLAAALAAEAPATAVSLVDEELALARQAGSSRAVGIALRAGAALRRGPEAIAWLSDAVSALDKSPDRLELAHALINLGAALRRANGRAAAREPLRRGLALATACGAPPLIQRAHQELLATGARPRRLMTTGRDALTPSELRIAELAATGQSNREIAQSLFITPKTVENHLGRIYKKLSIGDRRQITTALTTNTEGSDTELARK